VPQEAHVLNVVQLTILKLLFFPKFLVILEKSDIICDMCKQWFNSAWVVRTKYILYMKWEQLD